MAIVLMRRHFLTIPAYDLDGIGVEGPPYFLGNEFYCSPTPILEDASSSVFAIGKTINPEHTVIEERITGLNAMIGTTPFVRRGDLPAFIQIRKTANFKDVQVSPTLIYWGFQLHFDNVFS